MQAKFLNVVASRQAPKRQKKYITDMIPLSIRLHRSWVEEIDNLVARGEFVSRSEFIREAIRQLLQQYRPKKVYIHD